MVSSFKIAVFIAVIAFVDCGAVPYKKAINSVHLANPLLTLSSPHQKIGVKPASQSCDENEFNYCVTNFAKNLNLTELPPSAVVFFYDLISIVYSGLSGFVATCKAVDEFVACLGDTYDDCTSVANLVNIGENEQDATVYATLAQQLKYQCGPAYETFYDHYDCAVADIKLKFSDIVMCLTNFNNSIITDPSKMCDDVQTLTNCYKGVFSDCGADFPVALCETMKKGFDITLPQCTVSCSQEKFKAKFFLSPIKLNRKL